MFVLKQNKMKNYCLIVFLLLTSCYSTFHTKNDRNIDKIKSNNLDLKKGVQLKQLLLLHGKEILKTFSIDEEPSFDVVDDEISYCLFDSIIASSKYSDEFDLTLCNDDLYSVTRENVFKDVIDNKDTNMFFIISEEVNNLTIVKITLSDEKYLTLFEEVGIIFERINENEYVIREMQPTRLW